MYLQGVAARQRSRYLRFARPPQEKQLIEARKKTMKEKKAMTILKYVNITETAYHYICQLAVSTDIKTTLVLNFCIF